jgi:hypothetical protein
MPAPKDQIKYEQWRDNMRKRSNSPEWIKNHTEAMQKVKNDPTWQQNHKIVLQKMYTDPIIRQHIVDGGKKRSADPKWQQNHKIVLQNMHEDPIWQQTNKKRLEKMHADPVWQQKNREGLQNKSLEWQENNIKALEKMHSDPIFKQKHQQGLQNFYGNPILKEQWRLKQKEAVCGGFWYGSVTYENRTNYCILFNKEFKERCRSFYGYKSSLSGELESVHIVNGKPENLTVHHVYYQKKACCEWDKDIQGYYVMINLGSKANPNIIRYDIHGDPNKFVVLTHRENTLVNFDKLKWIKIFEDIIEANDNKCYYTKEEIKGLNTKA